MKTLKTRGVDFIEVQDAIPYDLYLAVAGEARRDHISFVGHVPPVVLPEKASALGQRSVEHMGGRFWGVLLGASKREAELHLISWPLSEEITPGSAQRSLSYPLHT